MEGLNPKQREQVTTMPTVRLIAKLIQFGHTEDELAEFERNDLMTLFAQDILAGKDKQQAQPAIAPSTTLDPQLERDRLNFEITKFEKEQALERDKMALEATKREQEQILRERELETENKRLELEQEKLRAECAIAERSANHNDEIWQAQREQQHRDEQRNSSLAARTKLFSQSISHAMPKMTDDVIDIPLFF